ncbi:fluoride efflux transporter FluC [Desulfurispora thermophila]|uniref:fluoride efflux transporter FluC n=1 Tax=Desulfurispora thermophila TaxID=265470 RepID=UPI00035EE6E9|nr:CrcB family protein [Desulfurispora thermophila]
MTIIISVGFGGVLGALARYGISLLLNSRGVLPWGTLAVNLLGSFLLAFFLTVVLQHFYHYTWLAPAVATGFIGSFTTFSSLSVELVRLSVNQPAVALLYLLASFGLGLLLAFGGRRLGDRVAARLDEQREKHLYGQEE